MKYQKIMIRIILFSICLIFFNSCGSLRTSKAIKNGTISQQEFYKEIDFNFTKGLLLVDIKINNKTYAFIYDTGAAVSVIEESFAKELNCKKIFSKEVGDAGGKKKDLDFVKIPDFEMGSLTFKNFIAASSDFSVISNFYGCEKKVYGILGNNIFRKAYWRIDYQKEKIWFGNDLADFEGIENDTKIELSIGKIGNAYVQVTLDSIRTKFTFDTGKRGKISGNGTLFNKILEKNKDLQYTQNKGLTSISLNGKNYGIVNHTLIKNISFGDIQLYNQIIELKESTNASRLMGNEIWENYLLTVDWKTGHLYLRPNQEMAQKTFAKFEYLILDDYETRTFKISNKWLSHPTTFEIAEENQIVSIEGINVKNLDDSSYCDFVNNNLPEINKKEKVELDVLIEGQTKTITLRKAELLSVKNGG